MATVPSQTAPTPEKVPPKPEETEDLDEKFENKLEKETEEETDDGGDTTVGGNGEDTVAGGDGEGAEKEEPASEFVAPDVPQPDYQTYQSASETLRSLAEQQKKLDADYEAAEAKVAKGDIDDLAVSALYSRLQARQGRIDRARNEAQATVNFISQQHQQWEKAQQQQQWAQWGDQNKAIAGGNPVAAARTAQRLWSDCLSEAYAKNPRATTEYLRGMASAAWESKLAALRAKAAKPASSPSADEPPARPNPQRVLPRGVSQARPPSPRKEPEEELARFAKDMHKLIE